MKKTMATVCALALVSGGLLAAQSSPQGSSASPSPAAHKKTVSKKKSAARSKPAEAVVSQIPAQETPPVPATLMNKPPVKPSVTLEGGLLTIDAPNSTLNDVLNGVRKATGATIEGANPTERVVVKLGPGEPGQVLAALLRGTLYDYIILGAPGKPDELTRVMLSVQSSGGSSTSAGASEPQRPSGGGVGQPRMLSPRQPQGDPDAADRNPPEENAPEAEEEQPQAQPAQPQPQQTPASDANAPKTPEQLFKELQQLNQPKTAPTQPTQAPQ